MEIKKNEESKVEGGEEECVHNEKKEFKTGSFVDNLESVVVAPHLNDGGDWSRGEVKKEGEAEGD